MKTSGKIFLYGLYTLAAVFVFVYLLFPSETVSEIIETRIAKANPNLQITLDKANPMFPPGLKMAPVEVAYSGIPVLHMDYLKVVPGMFSMIGNEKKVKFNGGLGRGSLKGHADLTMDNQRPQTKVTVNLDNVSTDALEVLDQWPAYQLIGSGLVPLSQDRGDSL